jgi:16S rRNA (cytosine1402-N4)-methyltransferase
MEFAHASVMVQEVMRFLEPEPGGRYLDGTLGGGGHAERILIESGPYGELVGLDRDDEAVSAARSRLQRFGTRLKTRQTSFAAAKEILAELNWHAVNGLLLDLGVSSHQLESPERGFSFRSQARLDMRMDRRQSLNAYEVVNTFSVANLERILRDFGEEPQARRIALAIAASRQIKALETTDELAKLIANVKKGRRELHPATQTFQALRIAVNDELNHLDRFLQKGYELLLPKGRMVIISFQSLEDRLVKAAFRMWDRDCLCPPRTPVCQCGWSRKVKLLTKRPMTPSEKELSANPRARSARLRAVERV